MGKFEIHLLIPLLDLTTQAPLHTALENTYIRVLCKIFIALLSSAVGVW